MRASIYGIQNGPNLSRERKKEENIRTRTLSVNRTIYSWITNEQHRGRNAYYPGRQKSYVDVLLIIFIHYSKSVKREAIMFEVSMRLGHKRSGTTSLFTRYIGQIYRALYLELLHLFKKMTWNIKRNKTGSSVEM